MESQTYSDADAQKDLAKWNEENPWIIETIKEFAEQVVKAFLDIVIKKKW
jgi:hypothetical protein